MKKINIFSTAFIVACLSLCIMSSGCLKLQKDFNRPTNVDTLDAHVYTTALGYIERRAYGSATDTIFRRFYDAIIYSGIDTNEYTKPNRTYILLSNSEITTASTGFWAKVTVNGAAAKSWTSYSKADVKNYLYYLIAQGLYSHYGLKLIDVPFTTLTPPGAYTANSVTFKFPITTTTYNPNPNSIMNVHVSNANTVTSQLDYPIVVNGTINITTSDLEATNGIIQVVNSGSSVITPNIPQ